MEKQLKDYLYRLNRTFYEQAGEAFAQSRLKFWKGWDELWRRMPIPQDKKLQILDIGCGNGRFGRFLADKSWPVYQYTGMDESETLLQKAREALPQTWDVALVKGALQEETCFSSLANSSYDLGVMMAVLHHIPGLEDRQKLFQLSTKLIKPGGILVASTWQFLADPKQVNKVKNFSQVELDSAWPRLREFGDTNDYLINWKNSDLWRYCHLITEGEMNELTKSLPIKLLFSYKPYPLVREFNDYYVYQKI